MESGSGGNAGPQQEGIDGNQNNTAANSAGNTNTRPTTSTPTGDASAPPNLDPRGQGCRFNRHSRLAPLRRIPVGESDRASAGFEDPGTAGGSAGPNPATDTALVVS